MYIQTGDIIFDKYQLLRHIGSGAYGDVYLAKHLFLSTNRALKCIRKCQELNYNFYRETDILKNLRHPSVPIIYDIEENEDCVCIIEEYFEGESLNSLLSSKMLSYSEVINIISKLCDAVEYLHKNGILHLDIKADNILYFNGEIKLLDYGSALFEGESERNLTGTKWYAAPEMYNNTMTSVQSDIYSIGVLMLLLATRGKNIDDIDKKVPRTLGKIIKKCLSHSKKDRFSDIGELKHSLTKISKKKFESANVACSIAVIGAIPHCGTTHCARIVSHVLNKSGWNSVFVENNHSGVIFRILKGESKIEFNQGIFKTKYQDYVPNYDGCVKDISLDKYDCVVGDFGAFEDCNIDEIIKSDIVFLVADISAGYWEKTLQISKLMRQASNNSVKNVYTLCNCSSARDYGSYANREESINPIRIAYSPYPEKYHIKGIGKCFEKHFKEKKCH